MSASEWVRRDPVLAELTGPGGAFEIVVEDVVGVPTQVYKTRMRSLRELMLQSALRADTPFLVQPHADGGETRHTFGDHDARARAVAASLAALGVRRGDRVAIVSSNRPEWVVSFWAIAILGAVAVPLNVWWKTEELEFGLLDSGTKVLLTDARRYGLVHERLTELRELEHVFVFDDDAPAHPARPFAELVGDLPASDPGHGSPAPLDWLEEELHEDDVFAILYTSGTTGQPKGATVTHRQVLANLQNIICLGIANAMRGEPLPEASAGLQSAALLVVPLFHVTGCLATMTLVYATGGKVVLMPPGRFDPDVAMRVIEQEKVTSIGGVPTIMWRIVESPNLGRYDLSSVQRVSYGGAPAAPELVSRIEEVFPNLRKTLTTVYGLTETASVATANAGEDYFRHPDSVGRPVPTVEVKVVDDRGVEVPTGETGEIWLKGPTVMAHGYWRRPDANVASLTDGWFHTGDIGRVDHEGFVYLSDRAKDMIIRGGENVYSVEVEHVLFDHPDVVDAAVVGVPHRELGEEVKAVVQLKAGSTTTADDLREFCARHLADFKVPADVEIRDQPLPRNPAGKILKNELRGAATSFAAAADDAVL